MCTVPLIDDKKIVLVCDDSKCCLNALKRALQESYHVIIASSGYEAVSFACLYLPDIIVMDIVMYGLNGFEAIRKLKKHAVTKDIPVIFLSGLTEDEYIEESKALGAVAYLTKPVKLEALFDLIKNNV